MQAAWGPADAAKVPPVMQPAATGLYISCLARNFSIAHSDSAKRPPTIPKFLAQDQLLFLQVLRMIVARSLAVMDAEPVPLPVELWEPEDPLVLPLPAVGLLVCEASDVRCVPLECPVSALDVALAFTFEGWSVGVVDVEGALVSGAAVVVLEGGV